MHVIFVRALSEEIEIRKYVLWKVRLPGTLDGYLPCSRTIFAHEHISICSDFVSLCNQIFGRHCFMVSKRNDGRNDIRSYSVTEGGEAVTLPLKTLAHRLTSKCINGADDAGDALVRGRSVFVDVRGVTILPSVFLMCS